MLAIVQFFIDNPIWYAYCAGMMVIVLALAEKYRWWNDDYRWFHFPHVFDAVKVMLLCALWPMTLLLLLAVRFIGFIGWLFRTAH